MKNNLYKVLNFVYNIIINKIPSRSIRKYFLKILGAKIGLNSVIFRTTEILNPKDLLIENNSSIGWHVLLDSRGGIKIGKNVNIASYSKLITGSHDINDPYFKAKFLPIEIDDYVFIGSGSIILKNVKIGKGAVVSAGSVVTKDIDPYTVVAGVPAKKIGERNKEIKYIVPKAKILH